MSSTEKKSIDTVVTKKSGKKVPELIKFLYNHKCSEGNITHTGMGYPKGSFNIPDDEATQNKFMALYLKDVIKNKNVFNLVERHRDAGPVVIDIDLRFDQDITERQYTIDHITSLVECYRDEIMELCDINEDDDDEMDNLKAFVFERSAPYQTETTTKIVKGEEKEIRGETKDGIHIMFPFIVTEPAVQYMIREKIMKKCAQLFSDIPVRNKVADIYDRAVIYKNGWIMYGCAKPGLEPYKLTHVFNEKLEEEDIEEYSQEALPEILSLRNKTEMTKIRDSKKYEIIKYTNKKPIPKKSKTKEVLTADKLEEIYKLTMVLSKDRVENYDTWMEVGWCLHNINPESADLLNIWITWSKTSSNPKHQLAADSECSNLWDTFKDEGLGIGSLYYWAKKDDYEGYMNIKRSTIKYYVEKSLSVTHHDVAKVLYEMYKHQFVCVSIKNNRWYEYTCHRWIESDTGIDLKNKISNELADEYMKIMSEYNELAANPFDENGDEIPEEKLAEYGNRTKTIFEIVNKLKTTTFKKNLMVECNELFYVKKFEEQLDSQHHLIGFENGVYDLDKGEFREGRPDDFVTFSTENDYVDHTTEDYEDIVEQIDDFLYKILPNENVREYVMTVLASFLHGANADESFHIWTGSGRNGKSKLWELFELAFGQYCIKFPVTLLTQKRAASNAASPEVAQSKGKRAGNFQEPDDKERINVGLMKELTGSDKIKARPLFKDPIEFKPQFKLALLCNKLPEIPPDDEASWMRLKAVEFTSKFVDKPMKKNEFKKDGFLSQKLEMWKEVFMSILINRYYPIYKKNKHLIVPDEVSKYTREYQKTCDDYAEFVELNIHHTGNVEDSIDMNELLSFYKEWYSGDTNSRDKGLTKKTFKTYLEKILGKEYVSMSEIKCHILIDRDGDGAIPAEDDAPVKKGVHCESDDEVIFVEGQLVDE